MLTGALTFFNDKRKRFHRSDTLPAFNLDPNSDNPDERIKFGSNDESPNSILSVFQENLLKGGHSIEYIDKTHGAVDDCDISNDVGPNMDQLSLSSTKNLDDQQLVEHQDTDSRVISDITSIKSCIPNIDSSTTGIAEEPEDNIMQSDEANRRGRESTGSAKQTGRRGLNRITGDVKLCRSKSSAQLPSNSKKRQYQQHQQPENQQEKQKIDPQLIETEPTSERPARSSSNQRHPSTDTKLVRNFGNKGRSRKRGRTWIDKGRRSRSVNSVQKIPNSASAYETNKLDMLQKTSPKATWNNYQKIQATETEKCEYGNSWSPVESNMLKLESSIKTVEDSSKSNRYNVVRKLRRNNSTLSGTGERRFPAYRSNVDELNCQTAGDLLLPSRTVHDDRHQAECFTPENRLLLDDMYSQIEKKDIKLLIKRIPALCTLVSELEKVNYQTWNNIEIGLIEFSLLYTAIPISIILLILNFPLGSLMQTTFRSNKVIRDPLRFRLIKLKGDLDFKIITMQHELNNLIKQANTLNFSDMDELQTKQSNEAFMRVTEMEQKIFNVINQRETVCKLLQGFTRFPPLPSVPRRCHLMVTGTHSLLVRISPPFPSSKLTEHSSSESSCEEDTNSFPVVGRKRCDSDVTENTDDHICQILAYRIEWSTSSTFKADETHITIVRPPIAVPSILNCPEMTSISQIPGRLFRTGYYELLDLPEHQNIYVRVYSLSMRGMSEPCYSQPLFMKPSSWIEIFEDESEPPEPAEESTVKHVSKFPVRYVGTTVDDEFRALKQLLDQKLLVWLYKQANPCTDLTNLTPMSNSEEPVKRTKSPMLQRKRSFRLPFTTKGLKFVKQTKPGIYLAILCHTPIKNSQTIDNCHLVTVDDFLPMVCVSRDDNYQLPPSLNQDLSWFSKLIADPSIGPALQLIDENLVNTSCPTNLQSRVNLLSALHRLQNAFGTCDMGSIYPDVFRSKQHSQNPIEMTRSVKSMEFGSTSDDISDTVTQMSCHIEGPAELSQSVILLLIKKVENTEMVCCSNGLKWTTLRKFMRQNKLTTNPIMNYFANTTSSVGVTDSDISRTPDVNQPSPLILTPESNLLNNLEQTLIYSEYLYEKMAPGLYVALLQMQANMDTKATILTEKVYQQPYLLPMERIRKRSHVSQTEWKTVCDSISLDKTKSQMKEQPILSTDHRFSIKLYASIIRLTKRLQFTIERFEKLRIYLGEIIRISPEHAFIILVPSTEDVCLPPGPTNVPILNCVWKSMSFVERQIGLTYDSNFHRRIYSIGSMLDILIPLATQQQRQSIMEPEYTQSVERTNALQTIQHQTEQLFSGKRWMSDVITLARDRKLTKELFLPVQRLGVYVGSADNRKGTDQYKSAEHDPSSITQSAKHTKPSNTLRVYADYPTGLCGGISVRIKANLKTTVDEIIQLTLLNVAETVRSKKRFPKNKLIPEEVKDDPGDENQQYCLVSSVGSIQKCIPNHLHPLMLRPPWRTGRFSVQLVRQRHSIIDKLSPVTN